MEQADILDYALIGNSRAAALVSSYGSIDWCCLPDFDSPSIFAAILDRRKGGHFSIQPHTTYKSSQHYVTDTNVVQTQFTTGSGQALLTDAFTAMTEEEKQRNLYPEHEILRMLEGVSGTVPILLQFNPRLYYGKTSARITNRKNLGITFAWDGHSCTLLSTLPADSITVINHERAEVAFEVKAGEKLFFSLSYSSQSPAIIPELTTCAWNRMAGTITYWKSWITKCLYHGLYAEQVRRSALALKLLTHAPSGAIIAAPTTSLPENPGHGRNWDYRYCWLRDASFTTRVLLKLGFHEEVHAYMNWILHATQLSRPRLQVVYSVYGDTALHEQTLDWLSGYKKSTPVRIGNGADGQFQLDVYGEVLDAIYLYSAIVDGFDRATRKFIVGLGRVICRSWEQPDHGIWEIRSQRAHHTHSKVMCWVGLDRLIKLCRKYGWDDAPLDDFEREARCIREQVEQTGYHDALNAYVSTLGGHSIDASALTFSLVGYTDYRAPRMVSTTDAVCQYLGDHQMVYRYNGVDDGLAGEEGAFTLCNFWLVENLARSGSLQKAKKVFETTLRCMGPSGLLSEEINPSTGELWGNYPQAFTHIGLINAALALDEEMRKSNLIKELEMSQ